MCRIRNIYGTFKIFYKDIDMKTDIIIKFYNTFVIHPNLLLK